MPIDYGTNDVTTAGYLIGRTKHLTSTVSVTTSQVNNWDLSSGSLIIVNLDSVVNVTTYLSVTGIEAGQEGEIKIIFNASATKFIQLYNDDASSLENNRLKIGGVGGVARIIPNQYETALYINNVWTITGTFVSGTTSFGSVGGGGV